MLYPTSRQVDGFRRVVVTGAGLVTAYGSGWEQNCQGFRSGRAAFRPVTLFDVSRQRARLAAEVDLPEPVPIPGLCGKTANRSNRASRMLLLAAQEAWTRSGWPTGGSLPVVLGTTSGDMLPGQDYLQQALAAPHDFRRQATRVNSYQAQRQGLDLFDAFGFEGPLTIIANACASGANAVGHAWELVRRGRAERVLAGGYDALGHLTFAGFDALQALSPTPCRPFDASRDGLSLGEGAAMLALETLESARRRGAEILAEVAGYGASTDVHHLTQPHPEGIAAVSAMTAACACARVSPGQIDYLNAHGTATPHNDAAEAAAINQWAGSAVGKLMVSSTKAGIGHLLGAAGAVEAVVSVMALRGQWMPPQLTTDKVDSACAFPIVREAMDRSIEWVLSNSFGFGGANASLVFRRWS